MCPKRDKIVFLDRDGTIIEEVGYLKSPERVRFLPGVAQALRRLQEASCRLVVVSNQSGYARGLISRAELESVVRMVESRMHVTAERVFG